MLLLKFGVYHLDLRELRPVTGTSGSNIEDRRAGIWDPLACQA